MSRTASIPIRLSLAATLALLVLTPWAGLPLRAAPPRPLPAEGQRVRAMYGLRLRAGPYLDEETVLILRPGERVYPVAGPVQSDGMVWSYVAVVRGEVRHEGFCVAGYLERPEVEPAAGTGVTPLARELPAATVPMQVTAYGGLRLREGPGLGSPVRRIAPQHSTLQASGLREEADGIAWRQVIHAGQALWGAEQYLRPEP